MKQEQGQSQTGNKGKQSQWKWILSEDPCNSHEEKE